MEAPGQSDCWGCHGFDFGGASTAPFSGPLVPTLYHTDTASVSSGQESMLLLSGVAFTNTASGTLYESDVRLTADDGTSIALEPDIILDQGSMAVTIPSDVPAGNYSLQVAKGDLASNPAVVSVTPEVVVQRAVSQPWSGCHRRFRFRWIRRRFRYQGNRYLPDANRPGSTHGHGGRHGHLVDRHPDRRPLPGESAFGESRVGVWHRQLPVVAGIRQDERFSA